MYKRQVNTSDVKEVKETAAISRRDEIIINIVFIGVLLGFIFGAKIGSLMYVIPAAGVLVLLYTKTLTAKETVDSLTGDMVWMIAGVLVMSCLLYTSQDMIICLFDFFYGKQFRGRKASGKGDDLRLFCQL